MDAHFHSGTNRIAVRSYAADRNNNLVLTRKVGQRIVIGIYDDYLILTVAQEIPTGRWSFNLQQGKVCSQDFRSRAQVARIIIDSPIKAQQVVIPALEIVISPVNVVRIGLISTEDDMIQVRVILSLPHFVKADRWELAPRRQPEIRQKILADYPQLFQ